MKCTAENRALARLHRAIQPSYPCIREELVQALRRLHRRPRGKWLYKNYVRFDAVIYFLARSDENPAATPRQHKLAALIKAAHAEICPGKV